MFGLYYIHNIYVKNKRLFLIYIIYTREKQQSYIQMLRYNIV